MKRIDEPQDEPVESSRVAEAAFDARHRSFSPTNECPPETMLLAAASGEADSLSLDTLAEHLSRCDKCVERMETLIKGSRSGLHETEPHPQESEECEGIEIVSNLVEFGAVRFSNDDRGMLLGRYRIGRSIGRGSMGNVYEAVDTALGRTVAVKMLRADAFSAHAMDRFELEARAQATLNHPNIVALHEFGHHQGLPFLVMEYVAGGSLSKVLRERPLSSRMAASLMVPIARAVAHAHGRGLLHRDLKPSNILISASRDGSSRIDDNRDIREIDESNIPKIADFGLALTLNHESDFSRGDSLVGTVGYLAPERISKSATKAGPESDIYALGVILYECLTGRPPFQGEDAAKTLAMIQDLLPVPPSELKPDLPRDLETICLKCLEKEPRHRYATADELADDLHLFLNDRPIKARPLGVFLRTYRWCRRNSGAAAAIAVALLSLMILSIVGWVTAGIRSEAIASARASETEAKRLAVIAEASRQAEEKRREIALAQFMSGTSALHRFGMVLEAQGGRGSNAATIESLRNQYRAELVKFTEKFLSETENLGESPAILVQILSIGAAAHARNGNTQRAEELYRKLEEVASRIESMPELSEKTRFFAMHAASAIGNAYSEAGRNEETIRFLSECLNRWTFDIRSPNASRILLGLRHNLAFALKLARESVSQSLPDSLDQELDELKSIIKSKRAHNP